MCLQPWGRLPATSHQRACSHRIATGQCACSLCTAPSLPSQAQASLLPTSTAPLAGARAAAQQVTSSQMAAQKRAQGPSLAVPPYTHLALCGCTTTSPAVMQGSQRHPEDTAGCRPCSVQHQWSPRRRVLGMRPYPCTAHCSPHSWCNCTAMSSVAMRM